MAILPKIGAGIDQLLAVVAPGLATKRALYRQQFASLQRSAIYGAAKTSRLSGAWSPLDSSVNDVVGASAEIVRARVRQLVRDFPYFAGAVDGIVDYTVGPGITFQSRIVKKNDKLDSKRIQLVEDAFKFWADEADVARRLHFYDLMRLAKRQDVESGEFLLIKRQLKDRSRYLPYALQAIESDWLTDQNTSPAQGNLIHRGVEYNKTTGEIVRYHFTDPDSWGKAISVAAADVIHGFDTLRPGQLRGITPLAAGVMVAHDLSDLMDTEMDGNKMAAKWLAFVETENPAARQRLGNKDDSGKIIENLENCIIEYTRPGEKVNISSNPRPNTNFPPYVRLILTMISVASKVPYEILTGDYQGLNYSQGKMVRNDFAQKLRPIVSRHVRQFCQPAVVPFYEAAVLAGKIDLPGFFTNQAPWLRVEWQPIGMESIDPARETKSVIDQKKSLLRSPQEICRARGRDYEEVLKEIRAAKDMEKALGLEPEDVKTPLANNPAAIAAQTGDQNA